jgi:hypothetical protein
MWRSEQHLAKPAKSEISNRRFSYKTDLSRNLISTDSRADFSQGKENRRLRRLHKDFAAAALWKIRCIDAEVRFQDRSNDTELSLKHGRASVFLFTDRRRNLAVNTKRPLMAAKPPTYS